MYGREEVRHSELAVSDDRELWRSTSAGRGIYADKLGHLAIGHPLRGVAVN